MDDFDFSRPHGMRDGVPYYLTEVEIADRAQSDADWAAAASQRAALEQILALEATATPRRLREAALTEEGRTWLQDLDMQIAALRVILHGA